MAVRYIQEKRISNKKYSLGSRDSIELVRTNPTKEVIIEMVVKHNNTVGIPLTSFKAGHISNLFSEIRLVKDGNKTLVNLQGQDLFLMNVLQGKAIVESLHINAGAGESRLVFEIGGFAWQQNITDTVIPSDLSSDLRLEFELATDSSVIFVDGTTIDISEINISIKQRDYIRPDFYTKGRVELSVYKEGKGRVIGAKEMDLQYNKVFAGIIVKPIDPTTNNVSQVDLAQLKRSNIVYRSIDKQLAELLNYKVIHSKYVVGDNPYKLVPFFDFLETRQYIDAFNTDAMSDFTLKIETEEERDIEVIYIEANYISPKK